MRLVQPPFLENMVMQNGQPSTSWRLWFTNTQSLLALQGHSLTVATLPTGTYSGQTVYVSNGRKSGEGAGAGTGVPAWWDGSIWRTFYDNSQVAA